MVYDRKIKAQLQWQGVKGQLKWKEGLQRRESEVINLSSLLVGELKDILENVPEDYEVIMEIRTGCDTKAGTSIAYINGVKRDDEFKEIRLMN